MRSVSKSQISSGMLKIRVIVMEFGKFTALMALPGRTGQRRLSSSAVSQSNVAPIGRMGSASGCTMAAQMAAAGASPTGEAEVAGARPLAQVSPHGLRTVETIGIGGQGAQN